MFVFTILGCGSSTGVPRIGNDWGACDPHEPRNRRRRCSLLVERIAPAGRTTVLIDTSPDLREQLIDRPVQSVDGVLYTHDHADHTHGIDDLRVAAIRRRERIAVHGNARTIECLRQRFGYCFQTPPGSSYPPILEAHEIVAGEPVTIEGEGGPITALPFAQDHGDITSLGFRIGGLAYSCDLHALAEASYPVINGVKVWIVDALRWRPHPSHLCLSETLELIDQIRPGRAILTNMHMDLDYRTLANLAPPGIEPAFDGLQIELRDD